LVEALVVISVFILFFMGEVYFRSLYENKLHVQRLARAAAVAYAMDACQDNDPLASVRPDFGSNVQTTGTPSTTQGSASINAQPTGNVGSGGNSVGNAMRKSGFAGDTIANISLQAKAGATARDGFKKKGWSTTVTTTSSMSCGDKQEKGDVKGAIDYIKGEFQTSL